MYIWGAWKTKLLLLDFKPWQIKKKQNKKHELSHIVQDGPVIKTLNSQRELTKVIIGNKILVERM